jgi:phage terminase large subunit-like protein
VISRAKTSDNPGLPQERRDALYARYGGTTLGRQELDAELIEDVPGALWTRNLIKYREVAKTIVRGQVVPDLERIVVAIDPAVTNTADSDETGIVIDGRGGDGNGYTLGDYSGHYSSTDWAKRALRAFRDFGADRIVAEANNGGDLVETVIRQVVIDEGTSTELRGSNVPITLVHATRGKRTRAEPVAALYEQGRWFHAEPFPELEDQQCSYTGEGLESSPDRLDAHVWAATNLFDLSDKSTAWGGGKGWGH